MIGWRSNASGQEPRSRRLPLWYDSRLASFSESCHAGFPPWLLLKVMHLRRQVI